MQVETKTPPDYYLISTLIRPGVPVRFLIGGGEVTGMLVRPRRGAPVYQVLRDDKRWVDLPEFSCPTLWRPLDPAKWQDALPDPAVLTRHKESTAAAASQPSRAPAPSADERAPVPRASSQDWRDPHALTYSPPSEISPEEAEARLMRAINTDGLRRIETPQAFQGTANALADLAAQMLSSEHDDPLAWLRRWQPSPRDLDDCLIAMKWFAALNPPELWHRRREAWALNEAQKLLVLAALDPPLSWRQKAQRLGRSHEHCRRAHERALEALWRVANSRQPYDFITIADPMTALRARNRAAREETRL